MAKEKKPTIVERQRGKIHARIIDEENGLRLISGVRAVRVIDRRSRILIMEDYLPTLGKIDGSIVIVTAEGEVAYDGIQGFYKHQHNEFTLLIENKSQQAKAESEAEQDWEQQLDLSGENQNSDKTK